MSPIFSQSIRASDPRLAVINYLFTLLWDVIYAFKYNPDVSAVNVRAQVVPRIGRAVERAVGPPVTCGRGFFPVTGAVGALPEPVQHV